MKKGRPLLESASVRKIQTALQKYGVYRSAIDGVYGPATRRAVLQIEELNLLPTGWPSVAFLKASELAERRGSIMGWRFLKYLRNAGDIEFHTYWRAGEGEVRRVNGFNAFAGSRTQPAWGWSFRSSSPGRAQDRAMENCNIRLSNLRRSEHEKPDCEVLALGDEVVAERPRSTLPALLEDYAKHELKKAFGSFSEYKLGKGFKVVLVDYEEVAMISTWGARDPKGGNFCQTECHASNLNCLLYVVGDKYAEEMPKDEAVALVEQFRDGWQVGMEAFSRGTYKTAVRIWGRLANPETGKQLSGLRRCLILQKG